ncbi:gamma-glutamyl peptidase 5-like [Chenopodium quinoa]|uniref:Glutamine amidotransferase domain-containing protein n=1 Tax=Chenopodium quinoa TaxID=63459 RepID=A0A803MCA2_CHEQI|nr:gamma-glutamyl peptidase 5-like [Chenopodium quinoa]
MVNLIPKSPENELTNDQLLEETNRVLGKGNGKKQGKRFAVLLCADDSEYVKKKYGGYFGVFVRTLGEEGESWDVYRVAENEFPKEEELGMYDGFVITGSCSDAHSNDVWICKLVNLLRNLDSLKKKVLGICFGHQILGRALGGKIGRASSGWDIGLRTINLSSSSNKFISTLKIPSTLNIIECHQDEVLELPPKVEVIGRSNKTSVEMFRYGDHMMGIQGHPEYNTDILLHLIDRLLQKNFIVDAYANELRAKFMESRDPDKEAWRKLCVNFLKGRL